jgi:small subunit ribosomal protein S13
MARIAGVDLPNKAVKIALTYIYGIGRFRGRDLQEDQHRSPDVRINTLSADDVRRICARSSK